MSESNNRTIVSYENHIQEYIDGTPQEVTGAVKNWINHSLAGLPLDARIIEIGSAFGRDAAYIENMGYSVERTDATPGFVEYLKQNGNDARFFNALTDNFSGQYDLVFADAVLLHFNREETSTVVSKVFSALKEGGRFSFSLKQGDGEAWSEDKLGAPRYFCYWTSEQIANTLHSSGFLNVSIQDFDNSGRNNAKWLHILAYK